MYEIDASICTGCGICQSSCPVDAIILVDGVAEIDAGKCNDCGKCVDACPQEAIFYNSESNIENLPIHSQQPITSPYFSPEKPQITHSESLLSQVVNLFRDLITPQGGSGKRKITRFTDQLQKIGNNASTGRGMRGGHGRRMGGSGRRKRGSGRGRW